MSDRLVTFACACGYRDAILVLEEATGSATTQCAKCAAPILVELARTDHRPRRPGTTAEQLRVRVTRACASLRLLHDEVVRYLRIRDLEVHELPRDSPLRTALENAERELFHNKSKSAL